MYSTLHPQLAQAVAPRSSRYDGARPILHRRPPPSPLRGRAAHALAATAGRLDRESARRAVA